MKNLIERIKSVQACIADKDELNAIALDEELRAIILGLETIDKEHIRLTDEAQEIGRTVSLTRRNLNIWQDELNNLGDDVSRLLSDLAECANTATDDAAALRGTLEFIRDVARKAEYDDNSDLIDTHHSSKMACRCEGERAA